MNAARVAEPQRLFGPGPGVGDADARPARDAGRRAGARQDDQLPGGVAKVGAVVPHLHPEGLAEVARPARARVQPGRGSRHGFGGAQEDGVGVASRAADAVEHLVDSVYQVYICLTRLAVHHLGPRAPPAARATAAILLPPA